MQHILYNLSHKITNVQINEQSFHIEIFFSFRLTRHHNCIFNFSFFSFLNIDMSTDPSFI